MMCLIFSWRIFVRAWILYPIVSSFSYIRLYPYWIAEIVPKIVCQEGMCSIHPNAWRRGRRVCAKVHSQQSTYYLEEGFGQSPLCHVHVMKNASHLFLCIEEEMLIPAALLYHLVTSPKFLSSKEHFKVKIFFKE